MLDQNLRKQLGYLLWLERANQCKDIRWAAKKMHVEVLSNNFFFDFWLIFFHNNVITETVMVFNKHLEHKTPISRGVSDIRAKATNNEICMFTVC